MVAGLHCKFIQSAISKAVLLSVRCVVFFNKLAHNERLCDERIYEEVFVRRDKCLFEKTLTKYTKMPAYSIANVGGRFFLSFVLPLNKSPLNEGRQT